MGEIRDCRIPKPRSVPGKGRWLQTPHIMQSSFTLCLFLGSAIHQVAASGATLAILHWPHPCTTAITAPPLQKIRPTSFDAPTNLPGATHSSISSTSTERHVLECPYSTLFRHCTSPRTSSNTGCSTRALITPAGVTTPMS